MNKRPYGKTAVIVFMLLSVSAAHAQDFVQGGAKTGLYAGNITQKKMSARLTYDAVRFHGHTVPRVAEVDYFFAADAEEHEKLNTYGVIMISGQCQDPADLPFKSVYLKIGPKKYPLTQLLSRSVEPGSEIAGHILGKYRMDYYFLLPYGYTKIQGQLCIDWGGKRKGFGLNKFPAPVLLAFVKDGWGFKPEKNKKIDRGALKDFLIREFSFSADDAAAAEKNLQTSGL